MLSNLSFKIKSFWSRHQSDIFLVTIVTLVGVISFGLGRFSAIYPKQSQLKFEERPFVVNLPGSGVIHSTVLSQNSSSSYVASRNGTKYHFINCPGAKQIKEENKIWFSSRFEAEKAGFAPAANCVFPE